MVMIFIEFHKIYDLVELYSKNIKHHEFKNSRLRKRIYLILV